MTLGHLHLFRILLRHLSLLALLAAAGGALAQADPPGRVGRLNHAEGSVTLAPATEDEWTEAEPNRPLTRGDRLWTDRGSRAEIQIGSSAIRMDGQTRLEILALDDQSTQLSLTQGTAYVRVRSLPEGENFEIDTPNLAYRVAYPGDYRLDVDPAGGTTRVTIHSGTGAVYGESGEAQVLGGGQQVTFHGRALAQLASHESPPQDAFDRWAAERNRAEDQSIAARYVPREVVGYQQLDPHGQWVRDAARGAIWIPQGLAPDWAPYRDGRWEWIAPWGWTWIDAASWGFAPFHYGRWDLVDGRWAWVPGRLSLRPIYAPALVGFVDGTHGVLPGVASGQRVAWFPLAPGEMWQPGFRASLGYLRNVNPNMASADTGATYAYQHSREALTIASGEDFQRGRPAAAGWLQALTIALTKAAVVPPPPMPQGSALASRDRPKVVRAARPVAPAPPAAGQVIASAAGSRGSSTDARAATPPVPPSAAVAVPKPAPRTPAPPRQVAQPSSPLPRSERKPEPVRTRPAVHLANAREAVARHEPPPRTAESHPREVAAARPAGVQRRQQSSRIRQAQLVARTQQIKHEQQAKRDRQAHQTELARRSAKLRQEEQVRREAKVRQDERVRREAHASQVERIRRAADRDAQALREQRIRRDQQAQRESVQRGPQMVTEPARRDGLVWEQQSRDRTRTRPDLRSDPRDARPPEVWQRGIPILNLGPTS